MKEAGNYFQKAAGVLTYIRNSLQPRFRIKLERSSDLSEASLTAAIQLCLAQAIECFYERANKDQTSKSLSKVAAQTSDLYEQALEVARSNQSKTWTRFPAEWLVVMRCKRLLFQSIALLHTENSLPDPVNTAVGERVCRLRVAVEVAEQARKETKALKSPWSAGLKILVQEYLELMLSSFMLAEAANMQNYHQTEPDRRLLAPPPRPKVSLVEAFDFKRDVFGDETRFVDLLEGVKAPQVWGDFNGFAQSAKQTAVWVKGELKRALDLVESRLGKLDIRLAGSIHSETSPILSTSALMSAAAAAQQVRQETDKVLQKLAQAQYEENVLPSNEAISKLAELGKWTAGNVEESAYILDNIDTSSFPQDPSVFTHVGNLRGALSRISSEAAGRVEALASLKEELSALDFEVLDWNEDRLRAVVPMLQKAKDFVKQHVKSFDRESCLQKAEEIRQQCDLKFQEMASIENEIDTVGPTTDLHIHLGYRRRQLQILEAEVARIAENAETLATKVDDVLQSIESVSNRVHEERESRQIVADFDTALSHYQSFRANVTAEVQRATELRKESVEVLLRCLKLPTKPKGGSGGDSFGGASFGRASGNVQKDPLLLSILQKESKSLGISPSSSFPRSSDKRSFGSPSNRRASDFRHEDFIAAMPEDDDEMLAFVSSRRAGSPATKPTLAKQGSQGEIMKRMLVKAEVMHPNQAAKVFSKPAPIVTSHVRLVEDALKQLAQAQAETQASIQKLASTDPTPSTGRTVQGEDYMFISKAHGDSPISGGPSPLTANSARKLQRTRSQLRQLREASERNLEQVHSQLERKASLLQRMASSASSISLPDVITESAGSAIKGGLKKLVDGARNIVQNAAQSAAQAAQAGREERQRRREEHVEQKREQLATDRTAFIEAYNTRGSNKDQGNPGDETESNYSRSSSSVPRRPIQPKEAYGLPRPEVPVARESGTKVEAAKTVLIPASALQQKLDKERTRLAQAPQLNQWIRSSNQRERSTSDVAAMGTSKIRIVSGATTSSQASRTDLTENTADRQLRLDTSSVAVNRQVAQLKSASPSRKASGAGFLESDISNSTLQNASGSNIWAQSPLAAHPSSPTGAITRVPVDRVSLVPGQPRISRSEPAPASSRHGSISQLAPTSKPSGLKNLVDEDNATSDEELEAELAKLVKEDIDAEPPTTSSLSDLKGKGKEPEFRREPSVNGVAEHENEKFGGLPDKWASIGRDAVQESDNESAEDLDRPATNTLPALNAFSFSAPPLSKSVGGHNVRFGLDLDDEIEGETEEQPAFPEDHSDSEKPMAHHAHASSGHKKKKKGRR